MDKEKERRAFLWVMLGVSLTAVLIWYAKRLVAAPVGEWGRETAVLLSYFTNATNSLMVLMSGALLWGRGRLYEWFKSPGVQTACCLYIAFVGLGFWFILGGPRNVQSWIFWIPELTAHTLSPILGVVFWVRCVEKGSLNGRHPLIWLAYPIGYLLYWLIRGPLVGYYPYFFIDVNALGYAGVAIWSGALIVLFLVLGTLMWRIDRRQASRNETLSTTA